MRVYAPMLNIDPVLGQWTFTFLFLQPVLVSGYIIVNEL